MQLSLDKGVRKGSETAYLFRFHFTNQTRRGFDLDLSRNHRHLNVSLPVLDRDGKPIPDAEITERLRHAARDMIANGELTGVEQAQLMEQVFELATLENVRDVLHRPIVRDVGKHVHTIVRL